MTFKKVLVPFFLTFIFFSCKNSNEIQNTDKLFDSLETSITEQIDLNSVDISIEETDDKLVLSQKSIIFFMPKKKEISKIVEHYGSYSFYDFQTLFNDFKYLATAIKSNVENKNIHSEITTAPIIEIQTPKNLFVFKRADVKDILGIILYNGVDEPIVKYGMVTNYDLTILIREYFSYSNFENYGYTDSTDTDTEKNFGD